MSLNFPRSVQLSVFEPTKKNAASHVAMFFSSEFSTFVLIKLGLISFFTGFQNQSVSDELLNTGKDSTPHWARGRYDVHVCLHEFADIPGLPDAECGDRATGS